MNTLKWNKGIPPKDGWYWVKNVAWADEPQIGEYYYSPDYPGEITFLDDRTIYLEQEQIKWAGPIPLPEDLSLCCDAPVIIKNSHDYKTTTTNWYECTACHKPCDIH